MNLIQAQNFHKLCLLNPDILLIKVHKDGGLGAYFKSHNMYSIISKRAAKTKFTPGDVWINLDNIKSNYKVIQKRFHPDVIKQRTKATSKKFNKTCNTISQHASQLKSNYEKFLVRVYATRLALWDIPGHLRQEDSQAYLERNYYTEQHVLPSKRQWKHNSDTFDRFADTERILCKREEKLHRVRTTSLSRLE